MTHPSRALDLLGALALCVLVTSAPTTGQLAPAADWEARRTPWGDPDLQGIWDSKSTTPMERPEQYADREFLTDEEDRGAGSGAGTRGVSGAAGTRRAGRNGN